MSAVGGIVESLARRRNPPRRSLTALHEIPRAMQTAREAYPPAPWRLCGTSVQTACRIDSREARRLVPPELGIVPVWPGGTLGILYCATYERPSVLCYHELIVAPALVAARGRIGFWISHIYVDDPLSQAGGRDIWSLPKQIATFSWDAGRRELAAHCGPQPLCRIRWSADTARWPAPLYVPVISAGASGLQFFSGRGSARVGRSRAEIAIETGSALPRLGFENVRSVHLARHLQLSVAAPQALG